MTFDEALVLWSLCAIVSGLLGLVGYRVFIQPDKSEVYTPRWFWEAVMFPALMFGPLGILVVIVFFWTTRHAKT